MYDQNFSLFTYFQRLLDLLFTLLRGTLGICGVEHFFLQCCSEKISACGVAVIYSLAVCDVCIVKSTVFGEKKLSAVFSFP